MGELQHEAFQFTFNGFLKVTFQGSRVTSDAGLILVRELDERLGLATLISEHLSDSRRTRAPRRRASRARASSSPCSGPIEGSEDDLVPKAAAEAIRTAREKGPSGVIAGGDNRYGKLDAGPGVGAACPGDAGCAAGPRARHPGLGRTYTGETAVRA